MINKAILYESINAELYSLMDRMPIPFHHIATSPVKMNSTENQTVVASFISFLRQQKISEEHTEGIESKKINSLN